MKKIAIILDSFSGLYAKDIENYNDIFFLSLQVEIDGAIIQEGLEEVTMETINKIRNGSKTATSLPTLSFMQDLIKKVSKEYENVIFLPIPSTMSGTTNTLQAFTKNYDNIHIIDNHFVGQTYLDVAKKAVHMSNENYSIRDIISFINDINDKTMGYTIPGDLTSVISSGRLKGVKAHIIGSNKFLLIIKVYNKLSVSGIARSKKSAIKKVLSKIEKFCSDNPSKLGYSHNIIYGYEDTFLKLAKEYMKENLIDVVFEMKTSLSTFIHTGYGTIYIGVSPKIN